MRELWLIRAIRRLCNYLLYVFELLGESIVHSRSKILWAALLVAGVLFPPFAMLVAFSLLSYFYVRNWHKRHAQPAPWVRETHPDFRRF